MQRRCGSVRPMLSMIRPRLDPARDRLVLMAPSEAKMPPLRIPLPEEVRPAAPLRPSPARDIFAPGYSRAVDFGYPVPSILADGARRPQAYADHEEVAVSDRHADKWFGKPLAARCAGPEAAEWISNFVLYYEHAFAGTLTMTGQPSRHVPRKSYRIARCAPPPPPPPPPPGRSDRLPVAETRPSRQVCGGSGPADRGGFQGEVGHREAGQHDRAGAAHRRLRGLRAAAPGLERLASRCPPPPPHPQLCAWRVPGLEASCSGRAERADPGARRGGGGPRPLPRQHRRGREGRRPDESPPRGR